MEVGFRNTVCTLLRDTILANEGNALYNLFDLGNSKNIGQLFVPLTIAV